MPPAFFDQQQGSIIPASPFYAQQYSSCVGMQQHQYYPPPLPTQQDYRLPPLQVPREFSDFTEDKEDKACADQVIQESEKNYGAGKSKATKRVTQNEVLMSKITTTLLRNMSTFGVKALKKGGHGGNPAIEEMIALLNQDPEVMMATNHKELKVDTVKKWMDEDGAKLALEAAQISENAERNGSEKVTGGATKAQLDWKEVMERNASLTETKVSQAKPQMKLLNSSGAEAMFQKAAMMSGKAKREEAVDEVMKRRKACSTEESSSGSGEPSPDKSKDEGWKYPKKIKGEGGKLEELAGSLGGIFESYKTTSTARAQAEADEAAAKKLEAEARRDEARAKLLKAQANSDTQIISQIEKLTSMAEIAERNGDTTTAKMYHAKVAKLNQQLLDS